MVRGFTPKLTHRLIFKLLFIFVQLFASFILLDLDALGDAHVVCFRINVSYTQDEMRQHPIVANNVRKVSEFHFHPIVPIVSAIYIKICTAEKRK